MCPPPHIFCISYKGLWKLTTGKDFFWTRIMNILNFIDISRSFSWKIVTIYFHQQWFCTDMYYCVKLLWLFFIIPLSYLPKWDVIFTSSDFSLLHYLTCTIMNTNRPIPKPLWLHIMKFPFGCGNNGSYTRHWSVAILKSH